MHSGNVAGVEAEDTHRRMFRPLFSDVSADTNSAYRMIDPQRFTIIPAVPSVLQSSHRAQKSLENSNKKFFFPSPSPSSSPPSRSPTPSPPPSRGLQPVVAVPAVSSSRQPAPPPPPPPPPTRPPPPPTRPSSLRKLKLHTSCLQYIGSNCQYISIGN